MRRLQNSTGFLSSSETSGEDGSIAAAFTGEDYKDLIRRANTVPLNRIFKHYGLRFDHTNKKAICPFPSHKGGRETSGSFYFYPATNTFWCFGCKLGVRCCDFVAEMDDTGRVKAANKILKLFESDAIDEGDLSRQDFSEQLEIMLEFSTAVREFRQSHANSQAEYFIDEICKIYDTLNQKHDLNNDALRSIVVQLKNEIGSYNHV